MGHLARVAYGAVEGSGEATLAILMRQLESGKGFLIAGTVYLMVYGSRSPAHINWNERVVLLARAADTFSDPLRRARVTTAPLKPSRDRGMCAETPHKENHLPMAKIAKTGDRKKVMDTTKSTDCPKCGKPTRIVKRVKDRERGVPGGVYISCSACEFYEKL